MLYAPSWTASTSWMLTSRSDAGHRLDSPHRVHLFEECGLGLPEIERSPAQCLCVGEPYLPPETLPRPVPGPRFGGDIVWTGACAACRAPGSRKSHSRMSTNMEPSSTAVPSAIPSPLLAACAALARSVAYSSARRTSIPNRCWNWRGSSFCHSGWHCTATTQRWCGLSRPSMIPSSSEYADARRRRDRWASRSP